MKQTAAVFLSISIVFQLISPAIVFAQSPDPSLQQMASLLSSLQSIFNALKMKVQAFKGGSAVQTVQAQTADITTGLVGHWKFDEGSGTTAADSSGNNNTGTLTNGPTWTTGKIGGAVNLDGVNDRVTFNAINLGTVHTVSMWLNYLDGGDGVVIGDAAGNYSSYVENNTNLYYSALFNVGFAHGGLVGWKFVTIVRNGTSVYFYKDGVQVDTTKTLASNNTLTLSTIGSYDSGAFPTTMQADDVRIYNRALTTTDIQALYNLGSGPADTTAPNISVTAPASGSTVSGSSVTVSANASDNVGVAGVQFKLDGASLGAEDTASPYSIIWNSTTISNGSHTLTAVARDAAGNQTTSSAVTVTVNNVSPSADTQAPSTPTNLSAAAVSSSQINLSWTASTDNVGVTGYRVERCQGSTCTNFVQIGTPTTNSYNDTGLSANTTYRYQVRAADAAGNLSGYSSIASATTQAASGSSALANLAASMAPGTWAELSTNNLVPTITGLVNFAMLEFMDDGHWNPTSNRLYFIAASHHGNVETKFIYYDVATNTWGTLPHPFLVNGPCCTDVVHTYDHQALDLVTQTLYMRLYNSEQVWKYVIPTQTWSRLPDLPAPWQTCCDALEYFPELGGLVYSRNGLILLYNPTTNQWTNLSVGSFTIGDYQSVSEYSAVHKVLLLAGGNNNTRKVALLFSSGQITQLQDAPVDLGITNSWVTTDPISGNFLILSRITNSFYQFNPVTRVWTLLSTTAPPIPNSYAGDGAITVISIPTHGVMLYPVFNYANSKVFVYKHTAGTTPPPDTAAPSTPSNLFANIQSSSQINLSWTASTDNVGVAGYRVERCQGSSCANFVQIGTPSTNSYNDTGLAANTTYRYQVRAVDAANNLSSYSAIANATTQTPTPPPGGSDFATRCSQLGVVKCVGFDQASDIQGTWGSPQGTLSGTLTTPQLDAAVKASGNSSLKFTYPSNSGSDAAGSYFTNFTNDLSTQFGEGQEFYVQWRQRFSPEMLQAFYEYTGDIAGWKQIIVGEGDQVGQPTTSSCTELELVLQQGNYQYWNGFFYHGCGRFIPLDFYDGIQVRKQHHGPPYCYYPNDPQGGCYKYGSNEWMAFQMHAQIGTWNTPSSRIQIWMKRENAPNILVFDSINSHPSGFTLYNNPGSGSGTNPGGKYGKLWLLPYTTRKDPAQSHPVAYTWYDELIISTNKIADPGSTTPPSTLVGDLNADRTVNALDWSIMNSQWNTNNAQSDINADGIVNSIDFSLMNANWGRTI